MNTKSNILALPAPRSESWKFTNYTPAPTDRAIFVSGNIITHVDCEVHVEHYEGYAEWDSRCQDWKDRMEMSIRQFDDAEFKILQWMELTERAVEVKDSEISVTAHIYYWDEEWRKESGTAGHFCVWDVTHSPTGVFIRHDSEGPFVSLADAANYLSKLFLGVSIKQPT